LLARATAASFGDLRLRSSASQRMPFRCTEHAG
jgi:hypothetical protein